MEYPIIYYSADTLCKYQHIYKAKEIIDFDCQHIKLGSDTIFMNEGYLGGFFTRIPISPRDYRKENPTKASVIVIKKRGFTKFKITDDWGDVHIIKIANKFWKIIKQATYLAKKKGLIQLEEIK